MLTSKEAIKLINKAMPSNNELDMTKLPYWLSNILELIGDVTFKTPRSVHLLACCFLCAKMIQVCKITARMNFDNTKTPANLYGMVFLCSGGGKDSTIGCFDKNVFNQTNEKILRLYKKEYDNLLSDVENEANKECKTDKAKQAYIRENKPRLFLFSFGNATPEGFESQRAAFHKVNKFGGTNIIMSEFGKYIKNYDKSKEDFIVNLIEVFDHGKSNPKVIKGDKETIGLDNVSNNFWCHSSYDGLASEEAKTRLLNILDTGLARRSFLCYPDQNEYRAGFENSDDFFKAIKNLQQKRETSLLECSDFMLKTFEKLFYSNKKEFKTTEDTERLYIEYQILNDKKAESLSPFVESGIRSEQAHRQWKTLKLACIFGCITHPENDTIEIEDFLSALYVTEYYGRYYKKFYNTEKVTDSERLYSFLVDNQHRFITKGDLRKQKFVHPSRFKQWYEDNWEDMMVIADQNGYFLEETRGSRNNIKFKLTKIEVQTPSLIKLSVSTHEANNYIPVKVEFTDLHNTANSNMYYSAGQFSDNHRSLKNWLGFCNIAIFDYDSNISILQAQEYYKEYTHLITTTKSHQKEKNGIICDRFRVFLPLLVEFKGNKDEYKQVLKAIDAHFTNSKADQPVIEASRFYFGHPDGEHFYNITHKLVDWRPFYKQETAKPKQESKKATPKTEKTNTYNSLSDYIARTGGNTEDTQLNLDDILGTATADKVFSVDQIAPGNRNNELHRILRWMKDEGVNEHKIKQEIIRINNLSNVNLPNNELETMFKHYL